MAIQLNKCTIVLSVLLAITVYVHAERVIPNVYPLFKQCDPRWGADFMGGDGIYDTVCAQGCAMSSLAMGLNGKGYVIPSTLLNSIIERDSSMALPLTTQSVSPNVFHRIAEEEAEIEIEMQIESESESAGTTINPGTLNNWLRQHNGYLNIGGDPDNLNLTAVEILDSPLIKFVGENQKPAQSVLQKWIAYANPIAIAHVRNDSHFVLLTGYDTSDVNVFYCNDPFYNNTFYHYDNITDVIAYLMVNITSSD